MHQMNKRSLVCYARNHALFFLTKQVTFHAYMRWQVDKMASAQHIKNYKHVLSLKKAILVFEFGQTQ